jgi:hypothetical protein
MIFLLFRKLVITYLIAFSYLPRLFLLNGLQRYTYLYTASLVLSRFLGVFALFHSYFSAETL